MSDITNEKIEQREFSNSNIFYPRLLEPELFVDDGEIEPSAWLRRYELFSRKNGWNEIDKVDLMEIYLSDKALNWFERQKSEFRTWPILKEKFMDKFEGQEMELRAWKNLQNLRQEEEEEVEELVAKLEKLFKKAKVMDETVRFRCLLSSIAPVYQRTILKRKAKTYKDAILIATDEEKLGKIYNYDAKKPNSSKKDDPMFKNINNEENGVYEMLLSWLERGANNAKVTGSTPVVSISLG
ncbi:hypothetical protein AYI69_g1252 [Smittium culicis]|uniref:Retrotransposon gag domain-containing protein n=1 Tax=Smittium culicis TaxID=133412 RepID=A0A1R1YQU2_9FUNG|nr:hypothetical protein AYI69_g1252 [Smittium culicis]